jgi:hypothetical protein
MSKKKVSQPNSMKKKNPNHNEVSVSVPVSVPVSVSVKMDCEKCIVSGEIVQYKETIDDYRNELKKTQSDAANKEKNNQILVVIGDLVGKIYHNIYYILKCDKNTPLTFRLPVEVDMCIFLKRAFTDYEENLKFALDQLNISYSDYYILVKSKRDRNNIMHSSMPVSDLYNILDESTFTDYEEIITTLNKYKLVIVSMDT